MESVKVEGQTFRSFAHSLMPTWEFPRDWMAWPPDLFALTSATLGRTGAYRDVIHNPWSQDSRWQMCAEGVADDWLREVSSNLSGHAVELDPSSGLTGAPAVPRLGLLGEKLAQLEAWADLITMEQLRTLQSAEACEFAEALIRVHAIADEACTGFGLLGHMAPDRALARCAANLLLTAKGSLSRLPKHAGVVLPKMRTPQQGLTLRSLSHNLTYHVSEVEVIWRAMPWPNTEENTLNVLAVPWPSSVEISHFTPLSDTFQSVRYFSYRPLASKPLPIDGILEMLLAVEKEQAPVHLLVLPESALSIDEYRDLLAALKEAADAQKLQHVPMLVVGIHRQDGEADINEVRLSSYFAGRWYEMAQRKHHRWRLDRRQIRQYKLEGRFPTARNWYEKIVLGQRRLTFLAPNGWLALCPLICEDLAQLEPVSEVIRGVGPTLLVSLLADGPQLDNRWSARYASVLADDPGTSVLTLTSVGMVAQSQDLEAKEPAKPDTPHRVGLWKSTPDGWRAVGLSNIHNALLLTISAEWQLEFSADGRGDHENAATFRFEGVRELKLTSTETGKEIKPGLRADKLTKEALQAGWGDMRELSAATFAINALLHLPRGDVDRVLEWVLGTSTNTDVLPNGLGTLIQQLIRAEHSPGGVGIASGEKEQWPTQTMREACDGIREIFSEPVLDDSDYWHTMVTRASERLRTALSPWNKRPTRRTDWGIAYSVLTCIHAVLERARRQRRFAHGESVGEGPLVRNLDPSPELFQTIENALKEYRFRPPQSSNAVAHGC
jgi:hypothetical protein